MKIIIYDNDGCPMLDIEHGRPEVLCSTMEVEIQHALWMLGQAVLLLSREPEPKMAQIEPASSKLKVIK